MCYFCSPGDLRCHAGEFISQRGNTMPSIIYDSFDQKTIEVLEHFAEVEDSDPRLILILGYARIHTAIRDLIDQHIARQTNGRKPNLFKTQISSLRRAGVFDAGYYEFLRLYARVRNGIAHHVTTSTALTREPYLSDVLRLHELSSASHVWLESVPPSEDLRRSVFALAIAGCLAIELDFAGERKGFDSLSRRLNHG